VSCSSPLIVSAVYLIFCRLLELVVLFGRPERTKEMEILILRHELSVLRRQVRQPRLKAHDRLLLAALSRVLPRHSWKAILARPETLLCWLRRLVARRWTYPLRGPGRAPMAADTRELVVRRSIPRSSRRTPPEASAHTRRSPQRTRRIGLLIREIASYLGSARRCHARPVTPEVAGSSPVAPAKYLQIHMFLGGETASLPSIPRSSREKIIRRSTLDGRDRRESPQDGCPFEVAGGRMLRTVQARAVFRATAKIRGRNSPASTARCEATVND
jgi:hypothetical protein